MSLDTVDATSILVNIENGRYPAGMARTRRATPLDPDVRLLAALADPTRMAIVRQLAAERDVCACDFTSCCDVGQPTVSHHLRVLREAGIVTSERRGSWIYYRLAPDVADRLGAIARGLVPGGLIPAADLVVRRPTGTVTAAAARTGST
jgi:DNA-binding transcriptional ArsR family regulator